MRAKRKKKVGASGERAKISQNYQNFLKFNDHSVKIAPHLKKRQDFGPTIFKHWASFRVKISIIFFSGKRGLWVTAHNVVKQYGVFV